jgi:hypothetical protein
MNIYVMHLEYDPHTNLITGDNGDENDEAIQLIDPDRLTRLKRNGGIEYIKDVRPGVYYEIEFPIPDDVEVITFFYNKDNNVMVDEGGYVMFNIFSYVTPSQLAMFKETKEHMSFKGVNGIRIELIYDADLEDL